MGKKAPATHSNCMSDAEGSHFSVTVTMMNSFAMSASPSIAGKEIKHVKRSILEKALQRRSLSSPIWTNVGCATPCTMPVMVLLPMTFHFCA